MVVGLVYLILVNISAESNIIRFAYLYKGFVSLDGIISVWFVFLWAIVGSFFSGRLITDMSKKDLIIEGIWLSVNAGFWEELIFRWLLFSIAVIIIPFLNWCTFGLVYWIYASFAIPFTNWVTFGFLSPQLLSDNWVFGAAIVSSSNKFMDAHKGNGLLGYINSWFFGLLCFWLVFNYGIVTAIVVHILYDIVVFMTVTARAEVILENENTLNRRMYI